MKTKLKRVSRSTLAVILAIMMVFSTMLVGTISVNAVETATVYFYNGDTNWSNVYINFYGTSGYWNENGTGSNGYTTYDMKPVDGKDNWFQYTYDNISSKYLSFHSVQQSGYGNFHQTGEVIYINNFSTSTPYYTPDVSWSTTLNSGVKYYSTDSNPTGTWTADYPTGGDTSEKELYLIGDFGTGNHWNDDPIYQEYKFTYDSETSTYVLNNVPFTRSGGSYFRIYNKTDKNQLGTLGTSNVTLSNGVSESLAVSADGAFQYESSTEKNVNIVISGNLNSITVSDNVVAQTYSVTNNASGVTVDKTTGITAGDTVTITPEDSNKKITAATITDASSNSISIVANDSDGTATFKMPASNVTISSVTLENKTTSTNIYYFWYWDGSNNNPVEMTPKEDGTYIFYTNSTYLHNGRKFKIANSRATGAQDNSDYCVNYNIGQSNISVSDSLSSNNVTVTHNGPTDNNDIQINGTSDYNFVIQYKPDTTDGIHGTIKVWSVSDYENQGLSDTVTVMSKLNVTDGSGNPVLTATTDGTET